MKGATWTNDYLKLLFNATPVANIADNAASAPLTSLYLALCTADPGQAGNDQTTNEATYSGYARQAVARTSGGFTVSGQQVTLTANVDFPAAPPAATDVLQFWTVGTAASGAGKVLYSGPLGTNLGVGTAAVSDTVTIPGLTGVAVNDRITFFTPTGGTIPTGFTAGTVYYVKTVSGHDITLSATAGGATIDITAAGQVLAFKVTPITTGTVTVIPRLDTNTVITEQ